MVKSTVTFRNLSHQYLYHKCLVCSTAKADRHRGSLMRLWVVVGDLVPESINKQLLQQYIYFHKALGSSVRQINRDICVFQSVIRYALRAGIIDANCHVYLPRYLPPVSRPGTLGVGYIETLIKALTPSIVPIVLLMIDSGLRLREALSLRSEDIDLAANSISLQTGSIKSVIPVSTKRLHDALALLKADCSAGDLFPFKSFQVLKAIKTAQQRAGLPGKISLGDIRHYSMTNLGRR